MNFTRMDCRKRSLSSMTTHLRLRHQKRIYGVIREDKSRPEGLTIPIRSEEQVKEERLTMPQELSSLPTPTLGRIRIGTACRTQHQLIERHPFIPPHQHPLARTLATEAPEHMSTMDRLVRRGRESHGCRLRTRRRGKRSRFKEMHTIHMCLRRSLRSRLERFVYKQSKM